MRLNFVAYQQMMINDCGEGDGDDEGNGGGGGGGAHE